MRLAPDVAFKYIDAIKKNKDRIYVPYFVAMEFSFNKNSVKRDKLAKLDNIENDLKELKNVVEDRSRKIFHMRNSDKEKKMLEINDNYINEIKDLIDGKNSMGEEEEKVYSELIDTINSLKIGDKLDQSFIDEVEKEGEDRYKDKLSPGFNDVNKKGNRHFDGLVYKQKYGDLLIWKEVLLYLKGESKFDKVIYVTDDGISNKKNDLLEKIGSKTIGPKINLIDEMNFETSKDFYILNNKDFVSQNVKLNEKEMDEIDRISFDDLFEEFDKEKEEQEKQRQKEIDDFFEEFNKEQEEQEKQRQKEINDFFEEFDKEKEQKEKEQKEKEINDFFKDNNEDIND